MSHSDELWQAELDFVRRTAELGAEGWSSSFAEDGAQLRPGLPPVVGRTAIRELMAPALAQEGLEFTWEPLRAEVAAADDMGFTYGTWRIAVHGQQRSTGKYLSVWRRDESGAWRVLVDTGNRDEPG